MSKVEVFIQCATGENWESKKFECNLSAWQSIIRCTNDRLLGLAIPYVIAEEREWKKSCWDLLFLDRLRISGVIGNKALPDEGKSWIDWSKARIREVNEKN